MFPVRTKPKENNQDQANQVDQANQKEVSTKFVLGLLATLRSLGGETLARQLLQEEKGTKALLLEPHGWLSQRKAITLLERAATLSNHPRLPEQLVREFLNLTALADLRLVLQSSPSPHEAYSAWLQANHRLGNADLPDYLPGKRNRARFIYYYAPETVPHPLYCRYRQALLAHLPELLGLPPATVQEIKCAAQGGQACHYKVHWTKRPLRSAALNGAVFGVLAGSVLAIVLNFVSPAITATQLTLASLIPFASSLLAGHLLDLQRFHQRKARLINQQHHLLSCQANQMEHNQQTLARFTAKLHKHAQLNVTKLAQLNEHLNQINYELLQRNCQILREHEALINRQEQEHALARSIQQAILLDEQEFQAQTGLLEGALAYHTADQYVGGDFYDYWEDGAHACVLVGDVAGHGLGAVQVVHSVLSYFRSIEKKHYPERLIRTLHSYLKKDLGHSQIPSYATAIYGVVTPGQLQYINAGQRHGFVYKPGEQRFIPLVSSQRPLGSPITENHHFHNRSIPLAKNDLIVIHTDGLVEAHNGQEEFGSHRVEQLVRQHYRPTANSTSGPTYPHPQEIKEALLHQWRQFQKPGRADDVTLVVLKQ